MNLNCFSKTDPGLKRKKNEDSLIIKKMGHHSLLFAVADGVGGNKGGEIASQTAVGVIGDHDFSESIETADEGFCSLFNKIQIKIKQKGLVSKELEHMSTTLIVAWLLNQSLHWAYVGDSRLYLFRKGNLQLLTRDHTLPGLLVKEGEITLDASRFHPLRNAVTKWLGKNSDRPEAVGQKTDQPDTGKCEVMEGDIIFACSDGLSDELPHKTIAGILGREKPENISRVLVEAALGSGGKDNISLAGVYLN